MQSMQRQRTLYLKYGTCTPDSEFRTIYIKGVPVRKSIREIVGYKEIRVKEIEAQREINLRRRATEEKRIEEVRKHNLLIRDLEMSGIRVRKR